MACTFLHTADWHMGRLPSQSLGKQRYREHQATQARILQLARDEGVDVLLLAGDILEHGCTPTSEINTWLAQLAELPAQVLLAPGNHDPGLPDSPYRQMVWPDNVYIFGPVWEPFHLPAHDLTVWGRGFADVHEKISFLPAVTEEDPARWQVLLVHADLLAATSSYFPLSLAQLEPTPYHYVALGHVHEAWEKRLSNPAQTIVRYPGSPEGHNWSETGPRTVTLGEFTSVGLQLRYPVISTRTHHVHAVDTTHCTPAELAEQMEAIEQGAAPEEYHLVRFVGQGTHGLEAEKQHWLDRLQARLPHLASEDQTEEGAGYFAGEELAGTLRSELVSRLQAKLQQTKDPQEAACVRRALSLGLRALAGAPLRIRDGS